MRFFKKIIELSTWKSRENQIRNKKSRRANNNPPSRKKRKQSSPPKVGAKKKNIYSDAATRQNPAQVDFDELSASKKKKKIVIFNTRL